MLSKTNCFRYGDQLNPWGDIIVMGRAWCVLKPGARALVGVPVGNDTIYFNSHKLYGKTMFKHVFANWKLIHWDIPEDVFTKEPDCAKHQYQPLIVLERP